MILKDFAVHGMGMYTTEVQMKILVENRPIEDCFISLIPKEFKTSKTSKIVISLTTKDVISLNGFQLKKNKAILLLDIVEYWTDFDFDLYLTMTRDEQKLHYWKMICNSVLDIAQQLNWDIEPLKSIYIKGIEQKFM